MEDLNHHNLEKRMDMNKATICFLYNIERQNIAIRLHHLPGEYYNGGPGHSPGRYIVLTLCGRRGLLTVHGLVWGTSKSAH
jgi:hypothetical protein